MLFTSNLARRWNKLQGIVDACTIPYAALLLTAAVLADRWGRRRILPAGIVLCSVTSTACASASDPAQLIAARVPQGGGAALVAPTSLTPLVAGVSAARHIDENGPEVFRWASRTRPEVAGVVDQSMPKMSSSKASAWWATW
ncbi:MFS transporter [Actinoplanes sp. TRM 88003]|uniref:MFS transporter n=1 Tax=Paractinoplanes aksuensis TaxID=2939490 RepID=A0ABT1DXE5_9ACTN|nr:MFS transporter [Actinoplanes aksuensis]MCO8275452.1 MFS transporter [Actinoplanes aksuensis]